MARAAANAVGLADRFFELSLLGLVFSGYLAVVGSGYLDLPTTLLTAAGLLLRALLVTRVVRFDIPPRAVAALTIAYVGFYPLDYLFLSREFLGATVHLVCFLAVIKILTAKTGRDYVYVKIIAFLELLAAAVLSTNLNFFLFLALFLFFAVATFASAEIRRSTHGPLLIARGGAHRFPSRLAALSLSIALGILSLTAGLFFLLPRTAHAAFQRLVSHRYYLPGFSNEVRLGQIGEILQRSTPVMHVRIAEGVPPVQLKWRGGVLSHFDGTRWFNPVTSGDVLRVEEGRLILANDAQRRREGHRITYEVQLEAVSTRALFFAGIPEVLWINSPMVFRTATGAYRLGYGSVGGLRYGASSFLDGEGIPSSSGLHPPVFPPAPAYLQLPTLDPRIPALAREVTAGADSNQARALAIARFLRASYAYTTDLPAEEVTDPLADFLFERRKGHCEYYASAMAVMLRTLRVPSRVVTGFHGGMFNPISGWYVVRASDAHSWVEAWLPDRGWTTFDPTPPDPNSLRPSFWAKLNFYLDAAEMFWQDWVVSYDRDRQLALATRMGDSGRGFGSLWLERLRISTLVLKSRVIDWVKRYGLLILALAALVALGSLFGPKLVRRWKTGQRVRKVRRGEAQRSDATLLYLRMLDVLKRRGFQKPVWLTPGEFAGLLPPSEIAALVQRLTLAYNELRYGGNREAAPRMTALLEQLERQR